MPPDQPNQPHPYFKGKIISWKEQPLPTCDLCHPADPQPAPYDAPTTRGPWANLCTQHFKSYAIHHSTITYFRDTDKE